ncbi:DUF4442 domain-containing protein [Fluviicola taffensis]|uniref:DUF4442 domain-containing protein n=1 Tax=Fluviicola taffensis (strain DSM 16823 / NCIMB 13979 / RW262) TaxID=755732 RepID=F2IER6_FLUTR|nr:DUF4442 domain-containing protein [Fluviicola taffensis]AEA45633.1 hypothetical protein Fluta_3664 [Fluviicola taffensis DSM 16823]
MRTIFKTNKRESTLSKSKRIGFNFFPAYRRTGGRVVFLSDDWLEVHVQLKLSLRTKNYVGSVFGGSIYGSLDPIYMAQLINILGKDYVVWDKAATVKFIRPIKKKVFARFVILDESVKHIIETVKEHGKCVIDFDTRFEDETGIIYAEVNKILYIADKQFYKSKKNG